jgi:RNA polymerase-binding transcription factor DksA
MKDTGHYKELLEAEKAKLESELASVGRKNPSNPGDWESVPPETGAEPDLLDAAEQKQEEEENAGILSDLEIRLNDVQNALDRIEKGTYGICVISGEEIEEDRLDADPAAATCKAHLDS